MGAIAAAIMGYTGTDIFDDFNRPDSAASLGSSASGTLWILASGSWSISNGEASSTTNTNNQWAVAPLGAENQIVTTVVGSTASNPLGSGIVLRANLAGNTGYVIHPAGKIYKIVAGAATDIGTLSIGMVKGSRVRASAIGSKINVKIDGSNAATVTDASIVTGQYVGLYKSDTVLTPRWPEFSARVA